MVLVDSNIWSEAFRKKGKASDSEIGLRQLIAEGEVIMIGAIRQEVLSGIRIKAQYERTKNALRAFPSQRLDETMYELAASFFNHCRSKGIQGSHTDFLICACAVTWKVPIFTKDKDFERFAKHLPIELA